MKNCSQGQKVCLSSANGCPMKPNDINYTIEKKTIITHYQVDKDTGDIFKIIGSKVKFRHRRPREIL